MSEKIVRIIVTGLVQGVGFRAFVADIARRHALNGWVRNRRDRTVEAVLAGPAEAIGEALIAIRRGPPPAQVDALDITPATAADLREKRPGEPFTVLPTA